MEFAIILWALFCVAVAILANRYRRNPVVWFLLSLILSPLVGFVLVLALGPVGIRIDAATAAEIADWKRKNFMDKVGNPQGGLLSYLPPARAHR
jgi:hypothetical protein